MAPRPANPELAGEILRVATELIEDRGADALTMRLVAERLGYSATTLYLYYQDKEDLIQAAVDCAFEEFASAQTAAMARETGALRLRAGSRAYVSWGIDHPRLYRAMFERPQQRSPQRAVLRRESLREFGLAMQSLKETRELPLLEDVEIASGLAWATVHGLVSLTISGRMFGFDAELDHGQTKARVLLLLDRAYEQWYRQWGVGTAF